MNYFQILGVKEGDEENLIRRNFYERSRRFHPDRFHTHPDPEVRELATRIYKIIAEAYNVLKVPKTRALYLDQLRKDPRRIRYEPESVEKKEESEVPTGPGARYYQMARQAFSLRNKSQALTHIKLALAMEPANELYKKLKEEIERL
jgi:curved DNA-binding protein CbpA